MLKFSRRNKKLVIPVGINPNYNIEVKDLYTTKDADVVAGDIIAGKVAYGSDGKIIGSLDISEKVQESYNEGIDDQKAKLETITITENGTYNREDGYNEVIVEVPDLNGSYDEGYEDGVATQKSKLESITITDNGTYTREDGYNEVVVNVPDLNGSYEDGKIDGIAIGRNEIIEGQSDATITPQTVFKGEIGYGANNEKIVGEFEYVEGFDFSEIGYSQTDSNELNRDIGDDIAYSKTLYDRWNNETGLYFSSFFRNNKTLKYVPNINLEKNMNTLADSAFSGCINLIYVPRLNTIKITNMSYMFQSCSNLTSVPQFDTSNVTKMDHMFYSADKITTVPDFNTPNVKDFSYMFTTFGSGILEKAPNFNMISATNVRNMFMNQKKITSIPEYDLSNVVTLGPFLYGCSGLTSVPNFNTSKATNYSETFSGCTELTTIGILDMSSATEVYGTFDNCKKLANINGMLNLGKGYLMTQTTSYHNLSLSNSPLTRESCLKIFNDIYDLNLKSDYTISPTIQLSSTTKALLSADDIAIATSKGWTIQ